MVLRKILVYWNDLLVCRSTVDGSEVQMVKTIRSKPIYLVSKLLEVVVWNLLDSKV